MPNRPRKSPQAEVDIASIWRFIADNNVRAADELLDHIEKTFDMLANTPMAGRSRSDLVSNLRSFPIGGYVVFYIPLSDGIEVVRVMSGRRDIDAKDMRR